MVPIIKVQKGPTQVREMFRGRGRVFLLEEARPIRALQTQSFTRCPYDRLLEQSPSALAFDAGDRHVREVWAPVPSHEKSFHEDPIARGIRRHRSMFGCGKDPGPAFRHQVQCEVRNRLLTRLP